MNFAMGQQANLTSNSIVFRGGEKQQCFNIVDKDVTIYGTCGDHDHGSSKVKLKNIVDYKWETKNYPGHLITVHIDGKHIAYVIKVNNKASGSEGMVRVTNTVTGRRALIKGMEKEVLDLQFAHIENQHLLACIEESVLHIHEIDVKNDNIICNILLRLEDPIEKHLAKLDKIAWCPFVPDENEDDDDEDVKQLIVWSRGGTFQCFNPKAIVANKGRGVHAVESITDGYLKMTDQTALITWIQLSPDGTTLGVGFDDGYMKFYQVYFHEKEPRCLHSWNPHNGKPISSFFFLDDITKPSAFAYWKHALTAADQNTEFKIWDCETWDCLQIIKFAQPDIKTSGFIAEIDRTSSYLVLSALETRTAYILQLENEVLSLEVTETDCDASNQFDASNKSLVPTKRTVSVRSISEFPLSSPILSFGIVDAAIRKYKNALSDNYLLDEIDDPDEECSSLPCVVIHMFLVQPKSVQDCHILYQPREESLVDIKNNISQNSAHIGRNEADDFNDSNLTEESILFSENDQKNDNLKEGNKEKTVKKRASLSPQVGSLVPSHTKPFGVMNLMTPDSFSPSILAKDKVSPASAQQPDSISSDVLSTILMLASVTGTSELKNKLAKRELLNFVNSNTLEDEEKRKQHNNTNSSADDNSSVTDQDNVASGKSSPSREVEEILAFRETHTQISNTATFNIESATTEDSAVANEKSSQKEDQKLLEPTINYVKFVQQIAEKQKFDEQKIDKQTSDRHAKKAVFPTVWPKVPDIRAVNTKPVVEFTTTNGDENHFTAGIREGKANAIQSDVTSTEINGKLDHLIRLVEKQNKKMSALQQELSDIKKAIPNNAISGKDLAYKTEMRLSKMLEEYLNRYEKEHKQMLEAFVISSDSKMLEFKERIFHLLNQFLFSQLAEKLPSMLAAEIQRQILPILLTKLEMIKKKIQTDVALKLTTTDQVLKESIAQVCKSKSIIDTFGNSVLLGVQNGLQSTYVQSMTNTLIPAYEKSSQEMFKQLHDTFSLGIKEVMEQFDNYFTQLPQIQYGTDDVLERITCLQRQIEDGLNKQASSHDISFDSRKEFKQLEGVLTKAITETINHEIKRGFDTHAASLEDSVLQVVRSQSQTPAPNLYDVQDQIKFLLNQGQINKAFHQALLANDLSLVEYTLDRSDYSKVFHPCVLEQTVLLSLIQQISADMTSHSDIKQRYLAEGILNLNQGDPVTKEHSPKVLRELYRNCQVFLTTNPASPLLSNVKMIMMAINGMGIKSF